MKHYHSSLGLYDFQARGVAHAYVAGDALCTWETGLGKSHLTMALASLLIEDGLVERVVVLAEANKVLDWQEEFEAHTDLPVSLYLGPKRSMAHPVVVSTYETLLRGAVVDRKLQDLGRALCGIPTLLVFDESVVKLRRRTSELYSSAEVLLREMRKAGHIRTLHLTATPIESSPENAFNLLRLVNPGVLSVGDFERRYVLIRDDFGRARFKNLGPDDHYEPHVPTFKDLVQPYLIHKAKTEPDIAHLFPRTIETFTHVAPTEIGADFYSTVADMFDGDDKTAFNVLRLIAGAPEALLASESEGALQITSTLGPASLAAIGAPKIDVAVQRVTQAVAAGENVVVFTFFGQTILPLLARALTRAGCTVFVNHGKMTAKARKKAEQEFRATPGAVFLSSDAGARGLNLPEATCLLNFELPLTHANYIQRINRVSRINSKTEVVRVESLIADGTIEEPIVKIFHERNDWHDILLADDSDGSGWVTADLRRAMVKWGNTVHLVSAP